MGYLSNHPLEQVVGDLLDALVWALLRDPMPDWINVSRGGWTDRWPTRWWRR